MQVSGHPGLLDTSELLRPEAAFKGKGFNILHKYFKILGKSLNL